MQRILQATVLTAFILFWIPCIVVNAEPLKLAAVGDSITTGAAAQPRGLNGYPALLAQLLAPKYEVRAFAGSSLCLLQQSDLPFTKTREFETALQWAPDVVTVMLGTNDTIAEPRGNWQHHADLEADTLQLVQAFRAVNPRVVVHLLGPPPMFAEQSDSPSRRIQLIERAARIGPIASTLRLLANKEPRVFYHDLTRSFSTTTDGVHPDNFGHEALAYEIQQRLAIPYVESYELDANFASAGIATTQDFWHGFERYTFSQGNAVCHLVAPHQTAKNYPWIWRARFFGHQPELDLSLLDRGFHVAYCDVANLYGSEQALTRWDQFYALATEKLLLSSRPVLEGMSRGGLPIFFWASRNPERVSAIYGDNPVCNSLSWPGGKNGKRSEIDWKQLLRAYEISESQSSELPQSRQASILAPIARQQVPIALVLGLADTVVPPSENGLPLASEYQKLGGLVKTWHKPGQGHHPHGLHPADPLRRFLLSATGLTENPAALPISSVEYRGGAGWGANWHAAFEHLQQVVSSHPESNIVFLGDSITQGLTGHQNRVAQVGGKRPIDRYFGDRQALSLGLSGDRTEHILWRLQNGQLAGLSPEWLVVMVGVNNISAAGHTGKETADGTAAIVRWLRSHLPDSRIVLCGCFPAGNAPTDPRRAEVAELHQSIAHLAEDSSVEYVDLRSHFLKDDGTLNQNMSADAIHITRSGQAAWMKVLAGVLGSQ